MRATDPPELITFLNTGAPFNKANLLTITLQSGSVIRITDYEVDVTSANLGTFSHSGPLFTKSDITHKRGVEVGTMTLIVSPKDTDLVDGIPWMVALQAGAFDYATVSLDVAIFDVTAPLVLKGTFNWFYGQIDEVPDVGLMAAELSVKSQLQRLDILMPRNQIQPGCLNTLFDLGCTLRRSDWELSRAINSVNTDGSLVTTITNGNGYYDEGRVTITSGQNTNAVRKIKQQVGGTLYLFSPFVFPIAAGTSCKVTPGCPKTQSACTTKFNNVVNFRGMPFVPVPETVL